MPKLKNLETGEVIEPTGQDLQKALASGQYAVPKGTAFNITDRWGRIKSIGADSIGEALSSGWSLESRDAEHKRYLDENYGGTASEVASFGAGLARGVSFGTSDLLATASGAVDKETLSDLREASPNADMAGEVVGTVLPALATYGASTTASIAARTPAAIVAGLGARTASLATAKIAGKVGTGLAGRVLASAGGLAAAGAVEGAAYGVGQTITEASLGDPEEAADNFFGNVGMSALLGAGGGAVFGAGGTILGETISGAVSTGKAVKGAVRKHLPDLPSLPQSQAEGRELALDMYMRQINPYVKESRLIENHGTEQAIRKYIGELADKGEWRGVEQKLKDIVVRDAKKAGKFLGDVRGGIDDAYGAQVNHIKIADKMDELAESLGGGAATQPLVDLVEAEAKTYRNWQKSVKTTTTDAIEANPLMGIKGQDAVTSTTVSHKPMTMRKLNNDLATYRNASKFHKAERSPKADIYDEFARIVRETENETLDAMSASGLIAADTLANVKTARFDYMKLRDLEKVVDRKILAGKTNHMFSLSDNMGGGAGLGIGMATGNPVYGVAAHVGSKVLNKVVREKGSYFAGKMVSAVYESNAAMAGNINSAAAAFVRGKAAVGKVAKLGGKVVEKAKIASPLAVPIFASKQERERDKGSSRAALAERRLTELNHVQATALEQADAIARTMGDPEDSAPRIRMAVTQRVIRAAEIGIRNAPINPMPLDAFGRPGKWVPPNADIAKFERTLKAINHPLSVLDDLANKQLSKEGAEVLREVYPSLGRKIAQQIQEQVLSGQLEPDTQQLITLSILTGVAMTPTMEPDFILTIQGAFGPPAEEGSPSGGGGSVGGGRGPGGVRLSGIDKLDFGASKTLTQKLNEE